MNSKEAFQLVSNKVRYTSRLYEDELKLIQQDLNRLEKLKKVIESLKDNIYFTFNDECTYICLKRDEYDECDYTIIHPNKEQYELLKEVLGNKWYNKPLPAFAPEENYNYSFANNCFQKAEKYDCERLEKEIKKYSEEDFGK